MDESIDTHDLPYVQLNKDEVNNLNKNNQQGTSNN